MRRLIVIFIILFTHEFSTSAQEPPNLILLRSRDTLTIYLPGTEAMNLSTLVLSVTTAQGQVIRTPITQLSSFIGLPFDRLPAPLCLHLKRNGTTEPLPQECQTILTFPHIVAPANIFWYDETANLDRLITIYGSESELFCPVQTICSLVY